MRDPSRTNLRQGEVAIALPSSPIENGAWRKVVGMSGTATESGGTARCCFCHLSKEEVAYLIAGPNLSPRGYICDECVEVCNSILLEERRNKPQTERAKVMPRPNEYRPDFPPSFALHVSQSQGEVRGNYGGGDFRALRGYTLKEAITHLYGVNPIRMLLPASLNDSKRYDFSIVLPAQEDWETMKAHMQQGLLDYFNLCATRENRNEDVYVVTAAQGRTPPLVKRHVAGNIAFGSSGSVEFTRDPGDNPAEVLGGIKPLNISALRGISLDGTADEFCGTLERILDRPVINETNSEGDFEFRVDRGEGSASDNPLGTPSMRGWDSRS
jgi:uncharacterized protein (TIGR03435 family)